MRNSDTMNRQGPAPRSTTSIGGALASALSIIALLASSTACAQSFPTKTVRLIAPYEPGGPTDIMSRVLAQQLTPTLGQQVIVENRPGAGGTTGAEYAAKAPGDGYTLLLGTA